MVEYAKIRLWADRVRMVRRWLEHPSLWPDGIDTKYERWYLGHEDYWRDRIGRLRADGSWEGGVDDEVAFTSWADGGVGRPREVDGEPWVEAGVSRATWYRQRRGHGELSE